MDIPSTSSVAESFMKQYGPFAFCIVSLLIIWFAIMSPELNRKQIDFETYSGLIKQHQAENQQTEAVTRTLHDTAVILDRVTQRIEKFDASH